MKFAEKFLNMMKLNDADDETEPFDEEYSEVAEEEHDGEVEEEGESVKVIRAQTFNEAQIVAEFLKEGKTIVVNLEGIEIGKAQNY